MNPDPQRCPCGAQLPHPAPVGRPRQFCSDSCRCRCRRGTLNGPAPDRQENMSQFAPLMPHQRPCWCRECVNAYAKMLHRHRRGLPLGTWEPTARPCEWCGWSFTPPPNVHTRKRFCSMRCNQASKGKGTPANSSRVYWRDCRACGDHLPASNKNRVGELCVQCKTESRRDHNRRKNARRRGAKVTGRITLAGIAVRDGGVCHLCRRAVDMRLSPTDRMGPTFDHLVPVVDGGTDDPINLALAHRSCNVGRRDRGAAQLRLIA